MLSYGSEIYAQPLSIWIFLSVLELSAGMFYALMDGKRYPFYNDADEDYQDKFRIEKELNEVVIGHWKNYDNTKEYYSKVS